MWTINSEETKLFDGKYLIPVRLEKRVDERIYLHFGYNPGLISTVKRTFEGRKWHGPPVNPKGEKIWSIPQTQRNWFRLEHLKRQYGSKPYNQFDSDHLQLVPKIKEYCLTRLPLDKQPYQHQLEAIAHGVSRCSFIWAYEMGTGKTLSAFMVMELLALWKDIREWIWVGPKSALRATYLETSKWQLRLIPPFATYEETKKSVANWEPGKPAPQGMILDEGTKVKTASSQRSVAIRHLADSIRQDHGWDSSIGIMSGRPAPKSPLDWWNLCEIACPGFLAEKDIFTFKDTLAVVEERERPDGGGAYPHLVTYKDGEEKCDLCGLSETDNKHNPIHTQFKHKFVPGVNEVTKLAKRMKGLVIVKFKKDCLDLPDKVYEIRKVDATPEILNIAKMIIAGSRSTIDALIKLRMLSDGFQYIDEPIGEDKCDLCGGTGQFWQYINSGQGNYFDDQNNYIPLENVELIKEECECPNCKGKGTTTKFKRETQMIDCPKDELLIDDLDAHEEWGRLNVYGGFTGTIDKVIKICHKKGWTTIRADGRGWEGKSPIGEILPNKDLLSIYDTGQLQWPKIVFIGQPGAAGMGLTLTASPTTVFFSNDFNSENRWQAEDRGHRIGMDKERGGRIVDYVHLDTDTYVLENLKKKLDLQFMSLTGVAKYLN